MRKYLGFLLAFVPAVCLAGIDVGSSASPGGTAGGLVSGGTASRLMSTDSSGNLQTHTGTRYDGSTVTLQGVGLAVLGNVSFSSFTIIDLYSASFGPVTAASSGTVTWTEGTDRLGEFSTASFTVTNGGYYEIIVHAGVSQTAGSACLLLKVGGSLIAGGEVCNQGVTGLASVLDTSLTRILALGAGAIVRVDASATTADATFQKLTMTIKRIP